MKKLLIIFFTLSTFTFSARKIEVIGQGIIKTVPNIVKTNLGIQTQKETVQEAMEINQKLISNLYEKLINLGIDKKDITTSQFYLNYYLNEEKKDVYTVSNNLEVKVKDLTKINEVLAISTKEGVNNIWGLNFVSDDSEKLAKKARVAAIEDAKKKAGEYATAAGASLGKVLEIIEIESYNAGFISNKKTMAYASEASVYSPEELSYTESVKVIFELK